MVHIFRFDQRRMSSWRILFDNWHFWRVDRSYSKRAWAARSALKIEIVLHSFVAEFEVAHIRRVDGSFESAII